MAHVVPPTFTDRAVMQKQSDATLFTEQGTSGADRVSVPRGLSSSCCAEGTLPDPGKRGTSGASGVPANARDQRTHRWLAVALHEVRNASRVRGI
jgi:hypothetical protein